MAFLRILQYLINLPVKALSYNLARTSEETIGDMTHTEYVLDNGQFPWYPVS